VIAAAARQAIGDKRGSRALLCGVAGDVSGAPLQSAVQLWSLQAQLAIDAGDTEQAQALAGRALRAASGEQLRSALLLVMPWLLAFVERSPDLSRRYRSFVSSLTSVPPERPSEVLATSSDALLEPLTERELQVLERLAQMRTTQEIAGDLFVSTNTVKTHIKSLFLKMAVNRRADAVRLGRELALI
jgi:LuxR family maltose regulon positive regulatory protein